MDDYVALRNREHTGIQSLVWGSDYPHYEGTWPESRNAIRIQAEKAGLTEDEKRAIFGGTLANLYGISLPIPA